MSDTDVAVDAKKLVVEKTELELFCNACGDWSQRTFLESKIEQYLRDHAAGCKNIGYIGHGFSVVRTQRIVLAGSEDEQVKAA